MNFSAEWLRCFFVKGKTRCGREEYAHLKSYRMSRFSIHLSHTHTHTQKKKKKKANALHVTSLLKATRWARELPQARKMDRDRWHTNTHTCSRWKQYPEKASQFHEVDDKKKKKHEKRGNSFSTRMYGQVLFRDVKVQLDPGMWRVFFFSPRDVPMVNKMWRKQRLRTTTHGVNRQIFIPWKSWVIEKEGAARRYRVLLPTLWW